MKSKKSRKMHGKSKSIIYRTWVGIKTRCFNKNAPIYSYYGGRGIKMCDHWLSFENFYEDMGEHPGHGYSIDRINNNGNYEPSNCRWATVKEQCLNRRKRSNTTSKHMYVCYSKSLKKWSVCVHFNTEDDAVGAAKILMHFKNVVDKLSTN